MIDHIQTRTPKQKDSSSSIRYVVCFDIPSAEEPGPVVLAVVVLPIVLSEPTLDLVATLEAAQPLFVGCTLQE